MTRFISLLGAILDGVRSLFADRRRQSKVLVQSNICTQTLLCAQQAASLLSLVQRCISIVLIYSPMIVRSNACYSPVLSMIFSKRFLLFLPLLVCLYPILSRLLPFLFFGKSYSQAPPHVQAVIDKCLSLQQEPGPPVDFLGRSHSDRYESGTRPVLIKGGRIWTGRNNGTQVIYGDILMDKGIIKRIGKLGWMSSRSDLQVIDVKGAWVTPGLVDIHSHIGDISLPNLKGSDDATSLHGIVQPWLRTLDGLNTHDETYPLVLAGGVTTSLILPGSADAIGVYPVV